MTRVPGAAPTASVGVDRYGGDVVDPTKNVEDLVKALEVTLDKLRQADTQRLDDLRKADKERVNDLREADSKRLAEIAALKREYDKQIFDIQTVQVKTTSDLISAQLSKETASLANQINAATIQNQGLISTLSVRIDKLEQARWEGSGRASVQDPATAEALTRMAASIQLGSESRSQGTGVSSAIAMIFQVIAAVASIGAIIGVILLATRGH